MPQFSSLFDEEAHHRGAVNESKRKYDYWWDLAQRHKRKCEECKEQRKLGYGVGCLKYYGMLDKADGHKRAMERAQARLRKSQKEATDA